jgi:tetratricopeptide (TPR) repeat protein
VVAFVCADPVWRLSQTFEPFTLILFLTILAVYLLTRFLRLGHMPAAYFAMLVLGLLCAETPFGFGLLAGFWGCYFILLTKGHLQYMVMLHPFVNQISKWYLTFIWAFGLMLAIAANVLGYMWMDGLEANAVAVGDLPVLYITGLWHAFTAAASAGGWILGAGVVALPLVLCFVMIRRATDEEYFLPYHTGVIFFFAGVFAYSQLASLAPLWFWTWIKHPVMVPSVYLQCIFSMMSAATLVCTLAVMAVDGYCRNHRRLAMQFDPEAAADKEALSELGSARFTSMLRRIGVILVPALIVAGLVPGRIQSRTHDMLSMMRTYVRETVRECEGAKWLFTDGAYDAIVELEAAAHGKELHCLSMMSGTSPNETYVRQQSLHDSEDRLSATVGAPNVLRTWQRDKKDRLKHVAAQLGLELWKRAGKEVPPVSGAVARPDGVAAAEIEKGVERAYLLAERILTFYTDGPLPAIAGPRVNDLFLFMQWRLARLARLRAERYDHEGKTDRSLEEMRISDALDEKNSSLKRILEGMARLRELTMRQMTPREGLQFALVRADFSLARKYAEPILDADPDDPNANFGMGMSYFMQEQFGRAEEYLQRCLKKNSKEPAVWNNIAVLQMRTGRLDDAMKNAKKALSLIPESAEVKDTIRQIEKAMEAAKTNKVENVEKGKK